MVRSAVSRRASYVVMLAAALLALGPLAQPALAAVATTTVIDWDPTMALAGEPVRIISTTWPLPDGGTVTFRAWTAQSGGAVSWSKTVNINTSTGNAVVKDIVLTVGSHWLEVSYNGSPYFAPSRSNRFEFVVTSGVPDMTMSAPAQLHPGEEITVDWTVGPSAAAYGVLELLVDGSAHASIPINGQTSGSWSTGGGLETGIYDLRLRFTSEHWRYGPGETAGHTLRVGDPRVSSGISLNHGRSGTNSRSVLVAVAPTQGGQQVVAVRLSNSADVADGVLVHATEVDYSATLPWTLAEGGDGERTVYAQLKGSDGIWSGVVSDGIALDTTSPVGTFVINNDDPAVGDAWARRIDDQTLSASVGPEDWSPGAISHVAVSNNGKLWSVSPFSGDPAAHTVSWQIADGRWGAYTEDGIKTVYMKWRDAAGNWSAPATDTIEVFWQRAVGQVLIDGEPGYRHGGSGYTSSSTVSLTFVNVVMPGEGLDKVKLYGQSEGTAKTLSWQPGMVVSWSLTNTTYGYTSGDGPKNIYVELVTNTGRRSDFGALVILDRVVPTTAAPNPAFAINSQVDAGSGGTGLTASSTSVAADITWTGSDNRAVASHRLQRSLNAGSWTQVTLIDPSKPRARELLKPGSSFKYRARTVDTAGNLGSWKAGPAFKVGVQQETSAKLTYRGSWKSVSRSDALGGTLRSTTAQGASVKLTFTGRGIAWVAPRMTNGASADVYVDGKFVKTVHLSISTGYHPRRVVFSMSWKSAGTHTIRIVKKYASNTMTLDALLVLN